MSPECVLKIFLEHDPAARSPYGLYGHPPMWRILSIGDREILARPGRTMVRVHHAWKEVDGVHWQERRDGHWVGQGMSGSMATFLGWARDWREALSPVPEAV